MIIFRATKQSVSEQKLHANSPRSFDVLAASSYCISYLFTQAAAGAFYEYKSAVRLTIGRLFAD